jgi:hypothetical protein
MTVSETLQATIKQAIAYVEDNPLHKLSPWHRLKIYDAIGPLTDKNSYRARVKLAILTGERVEDLWKHSRSDDDKFAKLLGMAEDLVTERMRVHLAEQYASEIWDWLSNDYGDRNEDLSPVEFFALATAFEVLQTSLGIDQLEGVEIREQDTDSDLDPWCSDAPKYAVMALAGPDWEDSSDIEKRLEFWKWWLNEAIPLSLEEKKES